MAFALVACVAVALQVALVHQSRQQRIDSLRAEQERLYEELEAVKEIAREAEPVVVLENGDGTRVIVDLDSAVQPASYRTYD